MGVFWDKVGKRMYAVPNGYGHKDFVVENATSRRKLIKRVNNTGNRLKNYGWNNTVFSTRTDEYRDYTILNLKPMRSDQTKWVGFRKNAFNW